MSRLWGGVLFALVFLATLVAAWPMRAALALAQADRLNLSAADVSGTIWSGRLEDAALGPMILHDVTARVSLLPLLLGQAEVSLSAVEGPTRMVIRRGGDAVSARGIVASLPLSVLGLPGSAAGQISIIDGAARFEGERCVAAAGRVQVQGLSGPGWTAPGLTGVLSCRDGLLTASLTGQDAAMDITALMALERSGRWVLDITANSPDPIVIAALTAQGFQPASEGLAMSLTGRVAR